MVILILHANYFKIKRIHYLHFSESCLRGRTRSGAQASLFQPSLSGSLTLIKEGHQGDIWWKLFPGSFKLIWFRNHLKECGQMHTSWFYIRGAASVRTLSPSHLLQKLSPELAGARWNLAARLFTRELLQKRHNYTFFLFPLGTMLRIF